MIPPDIRERFAATFSELGPALEGYAVINVTGSPALLSLSLLVCPRIELWASSLAEFSQLNLPVDRPILLCCIDDLADGSVLELVDQVVGRLGPLVAKRSLKVLAILDAHTDASSLRALLRAGVQGFCCIDSLGQGEALLAVAALLRNSVFLDDRFSQQLAEPGGDCRRLGSANCLRERERTVLQLMTAGYSSAEIANHLQVRPDTVRHYLSEAYQKIGVRDRSQAVSWCINHGLVTRRELRQLFG